MRKINLSQTLLTVAICTVFTVFNFSGKVFADDPITHIGNENGFIDIAANGRVTIETERGVTIQNVGGGRTQEVLVKSAHSAIGDIDTDEYGEHLLTDSAYGTAEAFSPGNATP